MQQYRNNVQDQLGNALASVTVTVNILPAGTPATIFSDDGVTPKANPFTNDSDGEFFFYAANGRYDIELTGPLTESIPDIILFDEDNLFTPLRILTDIVTADPPTVEAVTGNYEIWDFDNTTQLFNLGFVGSNRILIRNYMESGEMRLQVVPTGGGGFQNILVGDPDGTTDLFNGNDNVKRMSMLTAGRVELFSNTSTDVENRFIAFSHQDGVDRGQIGHRTTDAVLAMHNMIHGGALVLSAEDAGGNFRTILNADPDAATTLNADTDLILQRNVGENFITAVAGGNATIFSTLNEPGIVLIPNSETQLFANDIKRFSALITGGVAVISDGNVDNEDRFVGYYQQGGTRRAVTGFLSGSSILHVRNEVHGSALWLQGEQAGGSIVEFLRGLPDTTTVLVANTNAEIHVNATEDAIICRANGAVELMYDNVLQMATRVDGSTFITRGQVRHADGNMRDIGLATLVLAEIDVDDNLERQNSHKLIHKDAGVATSFELQNDSNIPTGTTWMIANEDTEDITIDATTNSSTLKWYDGLGAALPTGDRTLAQGGVCTVYKRGVNEYFIWGTGLS